MFAVKYIPDLSAFYDRTGIESYLQKQAKKGWHLEKAGPMFWKFRRGINETVRYCVVYQKKWDPDSPYADERKRQLEELCDHGGWELAGDKGSMQIYRSARPDATPIETDAALELENIRLAARQNYIFPRLLLILSASLLLVNFLLQYSDAPLRILLSLGTMAYLFGVLLMLISPLLELCKYHFWMRKAKKIAQVEWRFYPSGGTKLQAVLSVLRFLSLFLFLLCLGWQLALMILFAVGIIVGGIVLLHRNSRRMKENGTPKFENKVYTVILAVLMSIAVLIGVSVAKELVGLDEPAQEVCEVPLHGYDLSSDSTICEDCNAHVEHTLLYDRVQASCDDLHYSIVDVRTECAYGLVLRYYRQSYCDDIYKKLLGEDFDPEFRKTDYAPWSADDAYYLYHEDLGGHQFILCYDGRIVYLSSQEPFTPEQMDKVARMLGK